MTTDTAKKIVSLITERKRQSPKQLANALRISPQAIHRQLNKLQEQGKIQKIGSPPRVYYELATDHLKKTAEEIDPILTNEASKGFDVIAEV